MKRIINTIAFLLFFGGMLFAQTDDGPIRVELNARAEVFQLVPCGEQGVLMFYQSVKEIDATQKAWIFIFYDKALNPMWSKEVAVFMDFSYEMFYLDGERLFLAYKKVGKAHREEYNFQFLTIDIVNGNVKSESTFIPEKSRLVNFQVKDNLLVAGFNYDKEEALLLIRDLKEGKDKAVLFNENPSFIEDLKFNSFNGDIVITLNVYTSRKNSSLYLNTYDFDGTLKLSVLVAPTRPSEKLINGQLAVLSSSEIFVMGSFNHFNGNVSSSEENDSPGEESEGFYMAKVENGEQKFIRFYELLDFKNITQIMNNEELADVQALIAKENKKGKEQSLYYEFLIHDLKRHGDDFILLAEAYYPEYHQISTMSYDFYGRPMPYYYNVFDGYRYFNAFAVNFDPEGNLLWSNGIKIWDKQLAKLQKSVDTYMDDDDLVIFYNHDGRIVSKVARGYGQIGNVEKTKISTSHTGDVQLESSSGMISHWYGDYYLAYGYQTLRNNQLGGGSKRRVFYFNKLIFN